MSFSVAYEAVPILSAVLVVGIRLTFYLLKRAAQEPSEARSLPPADDPRWTRPPVEKQIVGAKCIHCERRFVVAEDARDCTECDALVHRKTCAKEHRVKAHTKSDIPYR